jgi:hypothetical protein
VFVEENSLVEKILREDIDDIYSQMDFQTRDHYRHQIEKLAKISLSPEHHVARQVINLAKDHFDTHPDDPRKNHVGYYLIG